MTRSNYYLFCIVLASVFLKLLVLALWVHVGASLVEPDSASYLAPAMHILNDHSFWLDSSLWMRTPGYPLFLAAIFKLFGVHFLSVSLIQLLLSSLLIINAYRIGTLLGNETIGLWAAIVASIDYIFLSFFALLLTDLLFAIVMSFIFYELILFVKDRTKRYRSALVIGLLLALATWIRPIPYYLTPLLAVILIVYSLKMKQFPKAFLWILLLVLPSLLLVGSWQIRNKVIIGTYQYTGIDAVNFYSYYSADIIAHLDHISFDAARQQLAHQAAAQHLTALALNDYYRHEGLKILFTHPFWSARQVCVGAFHTMFGVDAGMFYFNKEKWKHYEAIHNALYYGQFKLFFDMATQMDYIKLFLIVLFYSLSCFFVAATFYFVVHLLCYPSVNRSAIILCLIVMAYFLLLSSNVCGYGRFRLPFELMLNCFSVLGVFLFFKKRWNDKNSDTTLQNF